MPGGTVTECHRKRPPSAYQPTVSMSPRMVAYRRGGEETVDMSKPNHYTRRYCSVLPVAGESGLSPLLVSHSPTLGLPSRWRVKVAWKSGRPWRYVIVSLYVMPPRRPPASPSSGCHARITMTLSSPRSALLRIIACRAVEYRGAVGVRQQN